MVLALFLEEGAEHPFVLFSDRVHVPKHFIDESLQAVLRDGGSIQQGFYEDLHQSFVKYCLND